MTIHPGERNNTTPKYSQMDSRIFQPQTFINFQPISTGDPAGSNPCFLILTVPISLAPLRCRPAGKARHVCSMKNKSFIMS